MRLHISLYVGARMQLWCWGVHRVLQWAVGCGLFIMLCVSPAKPLLSQHRAPAALVLALLPYLGPMGSPMAYSAPQGQHTGTPTEAQTTITPAQLLNSH